MSTSKLHVYIENKKGERKRTRESGRMRKRERVEDQIKNCMIYIKTFFAVKYLPKHKVLLRKER